MEASSDETCQRLVRLCLGQESTSIGGPSCPDQPLNPRVLLGMVFFSMLSRGGQGNVGDLLQGFATNPQEPDSGIGLAP